MSSLCQIEANRRNAQKSTGPTSVTGKAASSMNALKTGIHAQSLILPSENLADLEQLIEDFYRHHRPATPDARAMVDELIYCEWNLRRLRAAETQLWKYHEENSFQHQDFPLGHAASTNPPPTPASNTAWMPPVELGPPQILEARKAAHRTYYMGMVDERNQVTFYDGHLRVVAPDGHEWARFHPSQYETYIEEHAEPWTYMKFCHLRTIGWQGFREGPESGIYCVAPLARLNAAEGMATPLAEEAYLKFFGTLGGKPVHFTLANHWARVIELLYAAEHMKELANHPELTDPDVRTISTQIPHEGIGAVEAPRGTLIHHYRTDEQGLITKANLPVATQNNAARIALSVEKAARGLISASTVNDGVLNMVEMAFRAYDPCLGCATHALPGSMPLWLRVRGPRGDVVATLRRDYDGSVHRD